MTLTYCPKCDSLDFMENVTTKEGNEVQICQTCNRKYTFADGVLYKLTQYKVEGKKA